MSNKMLVTAKQSQQLAMNEQLRQAISLLQYNMFDLKQIVQQYLQTNPFLEAEELPEGEKTTSEEDNDSFMANYSAGISRSGSKFEDDSELENFSLSKSLREHLFDQTLLCKFNPVEQVIAESIVDAIDDNGFLTMSLEEIQFAVDHRKSVPVDEIERILKTIQTFDPVGVGSRDMRECLQLQLEGLPDKDDTWLLAKRILTENFSSLSTMNPRNMMKQLKVSQEKYSAALELIRTLNPKPGLQYTKEIEHIIEPELEVKKIKDVWKVFLTDSILNHVKMNKLYQDLIKQHKKHGSYATLSKELQEAQWLLKGLKRRNETLLSVATYIVEFQTKFLEQGNAYMKPMNMLDVATALDLHESTVSRVTTGKYIVTPRGMLELKYFFPSGVSTQDGDVCSATAVKFIIKDLVAQEKDNNHVYSDNEIAAILQQKGINIARRTVAKYREALKILPSYQR